MQGAVVDFIDLQWWPVFNVADSCVVVGAILLVVVNLVRPGERGDRREGVPHVRDAAVMDEIVPAALAGERLDRFVAMVTGISRAEAADLVARARSGRRPGRRPRGRAAWRPASGCEADVDPLMAARARPLEPEPDVEVHVVHADDDIIVVDKPPGLVVHPGAGNPTGTLVQGLLARYPELAEVGDPTRPGIVHRLDKGTSGLLRGGPHARRVRGPGPPARGPRGRAALPDARLG